MLTAITSVWSSVLEFLTSTFESITSLFYTTSSDGTGSLTFIGTLAVIMAGIAIVLLVWNLIRSFFVMRG